MNKHDLIEEWIHKAEHDLGSARIIFQSQPEYTDTICFHIQQAVEKFLKAYCVYLDIDFQRSHDLIYLLELINKKSSIDPDLFVKCEALNDYGVEIRYPNDWNEPMQEDVVEAIQIGSEVETYVRSKIV